AYALKAKKDLAGAVAAFLKAIEVEPKNANYHANLANTLSAEGDLDEAIVYYTNAIDLDPQNALIHYNLGHALTANNDMEVAIVQYRVVIKLDPKNAFAHTNLGVLLCDVERDYDGAIDCFRKALELNGEQRELVYMNLGTALRYRGRVKEAIAAYKKAIRV